MKISEIKIINIVALYLVPIFIVFLSVFSPEKDLFVFMGKIAELMFIFIMFIKPISVIFKLSFFSRRMYYRKQFGILIFWFSLFHTIGLLYLNYFAIDQLFVVPHLFFSVLAMIGLFILTITSNIYSVRRLEQNWKRVQSLAYPAFAFMILHTALVEGKIEKFYIIMVIYLSLKVFQYLVMKKRSNKK
jgi:DMSO/TMAO reductase YedYZ heme-binding membrane subunit